MTEEGCGVGGWPSGRPEQQLSDAGYQVTCGGKLTADTTDRAAMMYMTTKVCQLVGRQSCVGINETSELEADGRKCEAKLTSQ